MIPVAIVGLTAAGAAAWYLDLLNLAGEEVVVIESVEETPAPEESVIVIDEASKVEESTAASVTKDDSAKADDKTVKPATDAAATVAKTGSRVTAVQVPTQTRAPAKVPTPTSHPEQGNRVAMAPPPSKEASAAEAAKELEAASLEETSATLAKARQTLRANFDESLFKDLDSLSKEQLKIRVVQLATEMEERTKWEAVRLKEFLAMKENETGEK
jgi:mitofilin